MRKKRILAQSAWYEVRTAVNNREPLFRERLTEALLLRVLRETRGVFSFEIRGIALKGARLSFYIRPADGFQLPAIMQWLKQTFAVRFNLRAGRTGHLWGDRYWSRVLEGEPPEGAGEADWGAVEMPMPTAGRRKPRGVSPLLAGKGEKPGFRLKSPSFPPHSPHKLRQNALSAAKALVYQTSTLTVGNGYGRSLPEAASGFAGAGLAPRICGFPQNTSKNNRTLYRAGRLTVPGKPRKDTV